MTNNIKGPLTEGFDMPGSVGQTRDIRSPASGDNFFNYTHKITIKQVD